MGTLHNELEAEAAKYLEEFNYDLETLENLILRLAHSNNDRANLTNILRLAHSLKGSAGSYGFHLLSTLFHRMEDHLVVLDFTNSSLTDTIDTLLKFKDDLESVFCAYKNKDHSLLEKFQIKLGLQEKQADLSPQEDHEKPYRILLVETSKVIVSSIITTLQDFNIEISTLKDGYEALGRLLKEKFDLLIIGGQVSTIDAANLIEILKILPNANQDIAMVVLSSSKDKFSNLASHKLHILEKGPLLRQDLLVLLKHVPLKKVNLLKEDFHQRPLSLWVLDDSVEIHKLIDISFKKFPHVHITHFETAAMVEEKIKTEAPDLILLDVQMPEINGDELFKNLKAKGLLRDRKVAFLTGTDEPQEINKLRLLNPFAILKKPFSPKTLPQELFELLDQTEKLPHVS